LQLRLLLKDDMMDASQNIEKMADITSDLARRWATHRVDAITRYGRIIADYGRGQTGERSALQALAKLAVEEAVRYPGEAITLAADYAKAWLDIAGVKVDIPLTSKHAQAGKRSDDIFLRGALGTLVTHDLVIENPQDRSVDVTISATPFEGAVGNLVKAVLNLIRENLYAVKPTMRMSLSAARRTCCCMCSFILMARINCGGSTKICAACRHDTRRAD
jgi:hypothetical protein